MGHVDIPQFVGLLVVMLGTAKMLGALAQRIASLPCPANWSPGLSWAAPSWAWSIRRRMSCAGVPRVICGKMGLETRVTHGRTMM